MNKPPLGIKPKFIREAQRAEDIKQAIYRYLSEGMVVPVEWLVEYNEILKNTFKQS
jgi:hypothetical protein